jgi:endonuclease/exonuclease/phosphatase family metal-dependent hydrolase
MRSARTLGLIGGLAASVLVAPLVSVATAPPAAAAQDLVFATFNVCKTLCAAPAPSWEERRLKVARVLTEYGLDVVGVQEATLHSVTYAPTQWADIQQLVRPAGYIAPEFPLSENACRRPRDLRGELSGPSPCKNTAGLLFRAATVEQVSSANGTPTAGITTTGAIAPVAGEAGIRSVMWAYLRGKNSTQPFLAVSLHADQNKDQATENARMALGRALGGWVSAMNAKHGFANAPAVLMADLNSFAKRQPDGVQAQLRTTGWTDSFTAPIKRNIKYSTINYNPALVDGTGFPRKPYVFRKTARNKIGAATRVDYIMSYGAGVQPLDYEVVIRLNRDGTFNEDYRASDHQMVRATMRVQ